MKKLAVLTFAALVVMFLMSFSNLSAKGKKEKNNYKAELASKELSSYGKTKAKGHAEFMFSKDGKKLFYKLYVYGIDSVSMAHIHHGPFGKEGPIATWLYKRKITGKFSGLLSKGTITDKDVNLDSLHTWMNEGDTYVLVHTQKFPNGEIGGKIH
ncbi:MAG: CHRD domain-containing protein [Bacteroidetes bacterium]|nr:CHRD domain-containing protein [Bacteroidota bacterium]